MTPDRTCHQAPRFMEFSVIRLPLAISTALCHHPIQWSFAGFGEIAIYRNNVRRIKSLVLRTMQPTVQQNRFVLQTPSQRPKQTSHEANARRPRRNEPSRRRLEHPPVSNTRYCLDFVYMTFLQQGEASWLKFSRQFVALLYFPVFLGSQRLRKRGKRGKVVLRVVGAVSVSSKPPAGVDERISQGERHGFGASVPSSTRASSPHVGRAGGSAILPKLVELVRASTARAEEKLSCFSSSPVPPSVRLRVFMCVFTSASVARRVC